MVAILIMAKAPQPGQVKTRLCPPLTPAQACACHEAFLLDTLSLVRSSGAVSYLAYSGSQDWFVQHCPDFQRFAQQGQDLAERLDHALQSVLSEQQPVLCIGSDSPHLPLNLLNLATTWLENYDVVLGPAQDGGYYLIGMNQFHDLFLGMPMSTHR
ncbi:MAG: TIGR04282 family arsenosugar biosynthesis glycosyltransferase, partial [Anaerolineae bacterium]|nr:TIGR04282 family arsenosugar biosynthesis glycosyltransferase [Gloeobacterales cyanobacterium ES-bin-313]